MPSSSLLDFDALLAPLPGERPAGQPVSYEVREQLENFRKEDDPADYAPDDPRRPEKLVKADWPGIVRLARKILSQDSKDLLVAARLTEALTRQEGLGGLRDGLRLLRLLVEQAWDRCYPELDDPPDLEVRATPFIWLDDPDRGAHFPSTLKAVPLVPSESGGYSWLRWQALEGPTDRETFEKAIQIASHEQTQANLEALSAAQEELRGLLQALGARMGPTAPGLTNLKQAVDACQLLARQIAERKGPPPAAEEPAGAPVAGTPITPPRATTNREEVYRQLAQAAATLQRLEPHSPIPYLIQRAVTLGALPFPELIKALIREPNVLSELNRELGIAESQATETTN